MPKQIWMRLRLSGQLDEADRCLAAHASINIASKVVEGICQQYRTTTKPVPNSVGEPHHLKDQDQKRHSQLRATAVS